MLKGYHLFSLTNLQFPNILTCRQSWLEGFDYISQFDPICFLSESGTVVIQGGNVTVKQDQQVEFQCLTTAWFPTPSVSWSQNGLAVNSSLYNTTSTADGDTFNSTSVLRIQAVSSTKLECVAVLPALQHPQSSSVFMVVGKKRFHSTFLVYSYIPHYIIVISCKILVKLPQKNAIRVTEQ